MNDRKPGTACPSHHARGTTTARLLSLCLTCGLAISALAAPPQPTTPKKGTGVQSAQMRGLNNALLQLHGQMQRASGSQVAGLRRQGSLTIAQRAKALQRLIATDPKAALSFAFSPELLADLSAKFPTSAALLESHVTVTGSVQHWVADYPALKASRSWWLLNIGPGQNLTLHFAYHEPPQLKGGDFLTATGVVAGRSMAVGAASRIEPHRASVTASTTIAGLGPGERQLRGRGAGSAIVVLLSLMMVGVVTTKDSRGTRRHLRQAGKHCVLGTMIVALFISGPSGLSAQNSCSTTGTQQVAVLIVTFPGLSVPSFSPSLYNQFFGPAPSLSSYWSEVSYGATSAAGSVFGPFTLSGSYSCANIDQFINDSMAAAAAAGVNFDFYNRVDIVFPGMSPSCNWAGLSSTGCYTASTSGGNFNISASVLDWTKFTVDTLYHENGHQLGLAHSRLRTYGTEVLGSLGLTGTLTEYGDHYAAMGNPNPGHYAAGHKAELLGWLSGGATYQNVTTSGTYTLQPYETQTPGLNALKIQRGTGNAGYYLWVEYRQPIGNFDPTMPYSAEPNGNVFTGALIHYEDAITGPQTDLLDFTIPDTYADYPALASGRSWSDPYSDLSLFVVSATSTALTINVNYSGSVPCSHANPSVGITPLNPSTYAGSGAGYTVNVTNNDAAGCSASTFTPSSTQPSGFSSAFSASSLTLNPGQSGSLTMTQTPPVGTAPGTYAVSASAANLSYVGTGTGNLTVMSSPSLAVSISVAGSSFTVPSTANITAAALYGGAPASGASVTFTVAAPNGSTSTQTVTTGTNGTATWNYKLNGRAPAGTYSVNAQASMSSGTKRGRSSTQSVSSNTVTFTVQ